MRRISAIFIAVCMVLIAGSLGAVLFLLFRLDALTAAIVALTALIGMALYNSVSSRLRDRTELGDQIADLSRGTGDLARQVAEMSRRLNTMEARVESSVSRSRGATDPMAAEIGELGDLVRQIADTVAGHESVLQEHGAMPARSKTTKTTNMPSGETKSAAPLALSEADAISGANHFRGLSRASQDCRHRPAGFTRRGQWRNRVFVG